MKTNDIKTTIFAGNKHKCRLMCNHDLNNYNGWWYVDILHTDDGLSMGIVVRNEKDLNHKP